MTMSRHCIAALSAQYHLHSSNEASDKLFLIGEIKIMKNGLVKFNLPSYEPLGK